MTGQMVEASSAENPKAGGSAPYRLAAISLAIVATLVALGVLGYGFSNYYIDATCLGTGGSLGSQRLPTHCDFPGIYLFFAGLIFFGELGYAGRVWSRR